MNPRVSDDVLLLAITRAKKSKPDEDIPLAYLDKAVQTVLQRQSAPATPIAAATQPAPKKPQGNDPKGTDETYEDWQARVTAFEHAQRNGRKTANSEQQEPDVTPLSVQYSTVHPIEKRPLKPRGLEPKGTDESYDEFEARVAAAEAAKRKGMVP